MNARDVQKNARDVVRHFIPMIKEEDWQKSFDDSDYEVRYQFMGTVLGLTPSGKCYTFFANSNVDQCPKCKGDGCDFCGHLGSREAYLDYVWREAAEDFATRKGLTVENGEGSGSDIFLAEYREIKECRSLEDDAKEYNTMVNEVDRALGR